MPTASPSQLDTIIHGAVEAALDKAGVLSKREEFSTLLTNNGASVNQCASTLAELLHNGREQTRHKVAMDILAAHGIDIRKTDNGTTLPSVVFNIQSEGELNLNTMFAPERNV